MYNLWPQCKDCIKKTSSKVRGHAPEHIVFYMCMNLFVSTLCARVKFAILWFSTVSRLLVLCFLTLGLQRCQLDLKSPSPDGRKERCANCITITQPQLFEKLKDNVENIQFWVTRVYFSLQPPGMKSNKPGYLRVPLCIVNLNAII